MEKRHPYCSSGATKEKREKSRKTIIYHMGMPYEKLVKKAKSILTSKLLESLRKVWKAKNLPKGNLTTPPIFFKTKLRPPTYAIGNPRVRTGSVIIPKKVIKVCPNEESSPVNPIKKSHQRGG